MTSWETITGPLGGAAAIGTYGAAGPTVTYSSTAGNTLIACGFTVQGGSGGSPLSATNQITSITDSAGNSWQFSLASSQFPASVFCGNPLGGIAWIAWCINAKAITSVTFTDGFGGSADVWNVSVAEWAGIAFADGGFAAATTTGSASPVGTVRVSAPNGIVVGVLDTAAGTVSATPAGTTALPGETGLTASSLRYGNPAFVPASPVIYSGTGNGGTSGGSSIGSITMPPYFIPGDLLILDVVAYNATVSAWPSGFTQQLSVTGATDPLNQRFIATKIATGSETVLSVTMSGATNASALLYVLRGAGSAVPTSTATVTANGYTTTLATPALTIANPSDLTVYGYGGITSARSSFITATVPGSLSNSAEAIAGQGTVAAAGWGINASPVASGSASAAVDTLDWAMDFPAAALGVGGNVTWNWSLTGGPAGAVAMMAFGPAAVPVPDEPMTQTF